MTQQNGLIFESSDYRNKFKVAQALWNPTLDVLALASPTGEVCLRRFYWKIGWQKKLVSEVLFFSKGDKKLEDDSNEISDFATMCWSPDGLVLAVAFNNGICHLLDVNDALILYTLRLDCKPTQMKWFKVKLDSELMEAKRKQLFNDSENSFNSLNCENLRTKDSDTQRDSYKIVYGLQNFCHSKVNSKLMDSVLVVVGERDELLGFDIYMGGMLLIKSVIFDCGFLPLVCDPLKLKVQDFCVLSNQNLQFALTAPLKEGASGRPEFDLVAGFTQPIDEDACRESTYIVEYDVGFHNQDLMIASALLAARTCHIFHLMVCLRENFQRACVDWETLSEQFHSNVFGTLYSKYEEETEGSLSDFALDFMSYILTGNYNEIFSQTFFRGIKFKEWKPAREFVVKHIPFFLHTLTKYITPIVDIIYVHLSALKGEIERFERNLRYNWNQSSVIRTCIFIMDSYQKEQSRPVDQIETSIKAICHLSRQLKNLSMVGNRNWSELKYVLQLLSSHPDNDQLKIEIEDEYVGIRRTDFEVLLTFITDALIDPDKKAQFGSWISFLHHWKAKLTEAKSKNMKGPLICNPNWLKHRLFDKIGPLLGTCDLPKPRPLSRTKIDDELNDFSEATTVNDAIQLCFRTMNDVYLYGIRDLDGNNEQPKYVSAVCLEFCHPHPITRLELVPSNEYKSLISVYRSSVSILQTYVTVDMDINPKTLLLPSQCCPKNILKLSVFGSIEEKPQFTSEKLNFDDFRHKHESNQYGVLTWDSYGSSSLHLVISFNDLNGENSPTYIIRTSIDGKLQKVDETPLSFANKLSLHTSPSSSIAVLFKRNHESLRWFELESRTSNQLKIGTKKSDSSQRILSAQSVQQIDKTTTRSAATRKRKLNTRGGTENIKPCEAMETDDNNFVLENLDDDEEEDIDQEGLTAEQLQQGYIVVEIDEPLTPTHESTPTPIFSNESPVMLQINEYATFTPPSQIDAISPPNSILGGYSQIDAISPPNSILNTGRYGSPATASTVSSPNRVIADTDDEERTENQEDYTISESTNTNHINNTDEDDQTEHDIEIIDLSENSRDVVGNNRLDSPAEENRDDEEMEGDRI